MFNNKERRKLSGGKAYCRPEPLGAQRLRWWLPLWGFCLGAIAVAAAVEYFYQGVPLGTEVEGVSFGLVLISVVYFVRARPNVKVNRIMYVLLGFSPIGLVLFFIEALVMKPFISIGSAPLPLALASIVAPFAVGMLIGDWIGRKRGYQLPFL